MINTVMTEQRTLMRDTEEAPVVSRTVTVPSVRLPQLRLGALLALGLAAFLVGLFLMNRGEDAPPAPGSGASAQSESQLRAFAESSQQPVYWAGAKDGHTYELTRTTDGRVYVRYLPEGTDVGDPRARYLTIGTYPRPAAFAELQRAARAKGAISLKLERGGVAVFNEAKPTSVYFGYPKERYQVEVYHPSADEARRLALSGQVVPVR
jgi:hypothetical protein